MFADCLCLHTKISKNLADAIMVLKIMTGLEPASSFYLSADVNADGKIGMEEFIFILQKLAAIR